MHRLGVLWKPQRAHGAWLRDARRLYQWFHQEPRLRRSHQQPDPQPLLFLRIRWQLAAVSDPTFARVTYISSRCKEGVGLAGYLITSNAASAGKAGDTVCNSMYCL